MTMDAEIERMRALVPLEGSSVPSGTARAYAYARRCEVRHYRDQVKIIHAIARLEAIASGLSPCDSSLQFALRDVVAALW